MGECGTPRSKCALAALIAAIAGLAAVLVLAFCAVRYAGLSAKGLSCYGNLGQVGLSLRTYAQDHDEHLPESEWCDRAMVYGRAPGIYTCPALGRDRGGYAMNEALQGRSNRDIADPASVPMAFDGPPGWNVFGGADNVRARHPSPGWYVVYVDGRVIWRDVDVVPSQQWEP